MEKIKNYIARQFRWFIIFWHYIRAWLHRMLPIKKSYSQNGEDGKIAKLLEGIDLHTGIYIDVGANQPSHTSNTYLFYRQGLSGILIEPDLSNFSLLKRFRPRDTSIKAVVGSTSKLSKFNYNIFSVGHSVHALPEAFLLGEDYIPQITLNEVFDCIKPKWVYLLSTDTEGNDLEVLRGANNFLDRTLIVCTEFHGDKERLELENYMSDNSFSTVFSNNLNIIFRNTKLFDDLTQHQRIGSKDSVTLINSGQQNYKPANSLSV